MGKFEPAKYNVVIIDSNGKILAVGNRLYLGSDNPDDKASGADINTGTDETKYVTSKAIEDSNYIKQAYADGLIQDIITNGETGKAPSQNVVFDALALKVDISGHVLTDNNYSNTDKAKVDFISVTQAVDLDSIESLANSALQAGNIVATITNGDTTHAPSSDAVFDALAGKQAAMGSDDNYVTDAEKVVIGNTSGTNTGDADAIHATPALTNNTNVLSSTAYEFKSVKLTPNTVLYSGQVDIEPVAGGVQTVLEIALAHASNFTSDKNASGTAIAFGVFGLSAGIKANVTNNTIEVEFISDTLDTTSQTFSVVAVYKILP